MDIFLKEIQLTKLNQTHDHGLQIHRGTVWYAWYR